MSSEKPTGKETVAGVAVLYAGCFDRGSARSYAEATDAEILAQPCVVEALRKAHLEGSMASTQAALGAVELACKLAYQDGYAAGRAAGWDQGFADGGGEG